MNHSRTRTWRASMITLAILSTVGMLNGCSLAPVYHVPEVAINHDAWQDSMWQLASAPDAATQGNWWLLFGDPVLNQLQDQLSQDNPSLAAALARHDEAAAYTRQLQSGLGPTVDAGASLTDNRQSKDRPLRGANQPNVYDANTVGLAASYPLDIWGQVRNLVAAGKATAQASAADTQALHLALQANLADTYINLRGVDAQLQVFHDAIDAYTRALELTQRRHDGGISSGIDVARAQTQLSSVRSEMADLEAQRAVYEHAIASLTGHTAMDFSVPPVSQWMVIPAIAPSLPSQLLLRRPDIAAAERRAAAANATIGVARAAYYPNLALTANYGVQNTGRANLFSVPDTFWSIGPAALLNLFDSGRHDAQLDQARAAWRAASADYRSVVLNAFAQVEDNLSRIRYDRESASEQQQAMQAAETAMNLALNRYREGAVNYLEVVTSQEAALAATRRALDIHTQQLRSRVALIHALGGGWSADQIAAH